MKILAFFWKKQPKKRWSFSTSNSNVNFYLVINLLMIKRSFNLILWPKKRIICISAILFDIFLIFQSQTTYGFSLWKKVYNTGGNRKNSKFPVLFPVKWCVKNVANSSILTKSVGYPLTENVENLSKLKFLYNSRNDFQIPHLRGGGINVFFNKKGFMRCMTILLLPLQSRDPRGPFRYLSLRRHKHQACHTGICSKRSRKDRREYSSHARQRRYK